MSVTRVGNNVVYLMESTEGKKGRSSERWNNLIFYGLELGRCIKQILVPILGIRYGNLLGYYFGLCLQR